MGLIIVSYDISDDRLRNQFAKFLMKFGHRIQYSVFEIDNSERILENIKAEISGQFEKRFQQSDSVVIFHLSKNCKTIRYGYAKNEEKSLFILS